MSDSKRYDDIDISAMDTGEDSAFGGYATYPEIPEQPRGLTRGEREARRALREAMAAPDKEAGKAVADDAEMAVIKPRYDIHIWGIFLMLIVFSVVEIFSASSQEVKLGNIYAPVIRHALFLGLGIAIVYFLQKVHYKHIYRYIPIFAVLSMIMMFAVLFVGQRINGTMRGLNVGGFTILPAEFLKLAVVLGLAWILSRYQLKGKNDVSKRGTIMACTFILISAGLLVSQGLTNTLLIIACGLSMLAISGMKWRKIGKFLLLLLALGGCYVVYKAVKPAPPATEKQIMAARLNHEPEPTSGEEGDRSGTWKARLERHFRFDKHLDPITEENRQEQLSYIAQARGGLSGVGIGNSRETARLPLAFSDYIFAIVLEECGMVIGLLLLLCYLWLLARAGVIAVKCTSTFACLVVCGCAVLIVFQALCHIAIVTGVLPVSGQPLPLISKGGTSVLVTCMAIGCMLSVSRHAAFNGDKLARKKDFESLPEGMRTENTMQLKN